jgi:hypothetical protein
VGESILPKNTGMTPQIPASVESAAFIIAIVLYDLPPSIGLEECRGAWDRRTRDDRASVSRADVNRLDFA